MIQPEFETIAQLRQENYRLQTELAQLRQENERLQRENTRSATEVAVSPSERRDRLLEVTATVASLLLTEKTSLRQSTQPYK
ncbi:MAG: hypothetical protein HC769_18985 [Cyanobacteria bacterium CRU_2_1]|nr:hypothetical protein [Cyanobacteria bacterium CRU_2_1]